MRVLVFFGLATVFWLGVISESIATCMMTVVCSYPRALLADAAVLAFLAAVTAKSWVREIKR